MKSAIISSFILALASISHATVTETDVSASFAAGSTGYQANVPGTTVNLLSLPDTTLTPSGAAPANPSLDPDRSYVGTSSSWSTLTDGSVGTVQGWLGNTGEVYIHDNWTLTYTFAKARTIGDMDVFSRWSDGGRKDPRVTIKYSTDGSNFTNLHVINYAASGNCAWVHLSDILVPGVVAVQFAFGAQQNGAVAYAELCVRSGAPSGLVAAPLPSGVHLNWTASPGATGYSVYRGTATGTYATDPVGSTTSATTYTDTGLTAGISYYYVVKATNSLGASDASNEASTSPAAEPVNQTLTFALGATLTKTAADAPFADTATAYPSGLPVTYSVPSAEQTVATVDSGTGVVTLTGVPGTAHVVADAAATTEFNAAQASQTLTVTQATTVITWPTPAPIEVGTLLSGTQLNASSGDVDGTFTYDPASGTALAEGTHSLSVQFTPSNTVKYTTPAPKSVSLLVIPVPPVIINLAYNNSMDGTACWQQTGTATFVAPLAYTGTTWNDGGNGSVAVSNLKKSDGTSTGISVSAVLRPHATGVNWGSMLGGNKLASYPAGLGLGSSFSGDSAILSGFVDILTFSGLATHHSYNIVMVDPTGWSGASLSATFKYLSQSAGGGQGMADWVSGKNYALLSDCIPNASGEITIQETIPHDWSALCGFQIVDNGAVASPTPSFASWITAYYATPSDPNAAPDADPDGDGLKNSVEYVLGTLPNTSNQSGPFASTAGGNFVFTFQHALASKNPDTKVAIEVSTDLGVWIAYDVDTAPEVAVTAGLDADHETVTLTLPMTPDTRKFARLRVAVTPAP